MSVKKYIKHGGEAIASGGFGCVFRPALKCKNKKRSKNSISKLMTKKNALSEYKEIIELRNKLNKIPDYEEYFLVHDFYLCEPEKLDSSDLKNFEKKCSALPKENITKKNINRSLDKVLALNMPYGGIPVDDYVYQNISYNQIIYLNNSLIRLLNNGIIPMNEKHVYHCDIKDSNVLVDKSSSEIKTRLIDWGLSTEYIPFKESDFPSTWRNRPFQFNVPFSVILFTDLFVKKYTEYLDNGGKIDSTDLKPFVIDYIYLWIKTRGDGHYKYINHIMFMLFSHDLENIDELKTKTKIIESDFTLYYINNYLIEILLHYTHFRENGTLNLRIYLDKVFIHIADVWGWVTCYLPVFEILFENYSKLNESQKTLFESMKTLFIKYLYHPRIEPINISELTNDFQNLNRILKTNDSKIKNVKTSTLKSSLGNRSKGVTGLTPFFKSSKKTRLQIKKNITKRSKNLLFLGLKKK